MRLCNLPQNASGARQFFASSSPPFSTATSSPTSSSSFSASSPPPTIDLRAALSYDGSGFSGFQLQGGKGTSSGKRRKGGAGAASGSGAAPRTVQGELEKALLVASSGRRASGESDCESARRAALRLHAAGRTDAGVHARGQAVSFALPAAGGGAEGLDLDGEKIVALERSLNRLLPADVRLRRLERCPPDFSARFSALGKHYSFTVLAGCEPDPLTRRHAHFERRPRSARSASGPGFSSSSSSSTLFSLLDVASMREAASLFVGQRDFTHFASINAAHPAPDPVRLIERASVRVLGGEDFDDDDDAGENAGDSCGDSASPSFPSSSSAAAAPPPRSLSLRFDFQGDGFLYRQVRHMSGALLAVGLGRLSPGDIAEKLERGRRSPPAAEFRGWKVADAAGLCLERVFYPAYDDFRLPIHADLPHDEFGRVSLGRLSRRRSGEREGGPVAAAASPSSSFSPSPSPASSSLSSSFVDEELRSVKAARRRAAGMPATGSDLLEREEKKK